MLIRRTVQFHIYVLNCRAYGLDWAMGGWQLTLYIMLRSRPIAVYLWAMLEAIHRVAKKLTVI